MNNKNLPPPTYQVPPETQGEWQPWLSRVSRKSMQPSTNATISRRWPSWRQALLGPRLPRSWWNWGRLPGKPNHFPTCHNACPLQCNGEMRLQWWEQWGAPPPPSISFPDCLFILGGTECFPFNCFSFSGLLIFFLSLILHHYSIIFLVHHPLEWHYYINSIII